MKLILASASPRRKEILLKNGYDFEIIPSGYNENILNMEYSSNLVENCAYNKASDVAKKQNGDFVVIGADTVVVFNNKILGKPKDYQEAHIMLKALSDNKHFVATSVCLINSKGKVVKDTEITSVTFRKLTEDDIDSYILYHNPLDKAGSYGIQDKGFDFAVNVEGELDNVIGFPSKLFKKLLVSIGE